MQTEKSKQLVIQEAIQQEKGNWMKLNISTKLKKFIKRNMQVKLIQGLVNLLNCDYQSKQRTQIDLISNRKLSKLTKK
jgi:uncharacterized protein YeeX (DUF496 family)